MTETVDLLSDPTRNLSVADVQRILYQRLEIMRLLMINRIEGFDDEVARSAFGIAGVRQGTRPHIPGDAEAAAHRVRICERSRQRPA